MWACNTWYDYCYRGYKWLSMYWRCLAVFMHKAFCLRSRYCDFSVMCRHSSLHRLSSSAHKFSSLAPIETQCAGFIVFGWFFYRYFVSFMTAVPLRYCEGSSPPQRGGTRFQRGARLPQTESGFHTSSLRANASLPHIPSMSYPSLFMLVIKWQWRWGKLWNGLSTTNLDCHQIPHSWERMKYVISLEMH